MSGAEAAIAGVGFLCSAMQIVTFGRDILQVYCQVRDGRSPDPSLERYLKSLEASFNHMKTSTSATSQSQGLGNDQQQMIEVGKKLQDSMVKLQSRFNELSLDEASKRGIHGTLRIVRKASASIWYSKELRSLEQNLKRYEGLLHSVMLHRVCNQVQAAEIKTTQNFQQLSTDLQMIVTKLANGCTDMSELSITLLETRNRITEVHETTRIAMDQGFISTQGAVSRMHNSMSQRLQESAQWDLSRDFEKHQEQLLESLRFSEMNSRKNHISENYPGTFGWVFENPSCSSQSSVHLVDVDNETEDEEILTSTHNPPKFIPAAESLNPNSFPAWLESDIDLFWISGKPASGKSSLMKFLATNSLTIKHLAKWQPSMKTLDGKLRIITHYFWKAGESLQNNIQGMLLSLLYQVLNKDPCLTRRLLENQDDVSNKRAYGDWSLKDLRDALCRTIRSSGDAFCIFLDGLDEAKELERLSWNDRGNSQIIHDLLCLSNVKICASSREEHPFFLFFEARPRLRIHRLTYKDIYCYAEQNLERSWMDCDYRNTIVQTIVDKANGVFLWVVLVLGSLNRAIRSGTASADEIRERLTQTPAELTDLFMDIWERPGDDAKLSSYKIDSSRYFSLVITANMLEEAMGINDNSSGSYRMNSLLVIATAVEDESVTSIIHKGRSIQAEELEDRCSRVASRLRLISRGLLETTTSKWRGSRGNPRLNDYNRQSISFIHKSAFDFITDTQFGRDCLSTCQWSLAEKTSRLLGGHLVRSRFLYSKPGLHQAPSTRKKSYMIVDSYSRELRSALLFTQYWHDRNVCSENSMLRIVKDWQEFGLFCAHSFWRYPQSSKIPSNPCELEFLEGIMNTAPRFDFIVGLLDQISVPRLIHAAPALLRAPVYKEGEDIANPIFRELVRYILTRLTNVNSGKQQRVSSDDQASVKNAIFLLHSWFIIHCLHATSIRHTTLKCDDFSDLLGRFSQTLSSVEDWQHHFALTFGDDAWYGFSPLGLYGPQHSEDKVIVAIANFVTAYRILGRLLQDRFCCTLNYQVPEDAGERFEMILIGADRTSSCYHQQMFSPTTEYHDVLSAQLEEFLFKMHTEEYFEHRRESWRGLLQIISENLTFVGNGSIGCCIREFAKRGLEFSHPWQSNWFIEELGSTEIARLY